MINTLLANGVDIAILTAIFAPAVHFARRIWRR